MATAAVRTHKRELEPHWRDALRASMKRLAVRTWGAILVGLAIATKETEATYLPILMMTGDTTPEARRDALSRGAKDFVQKPFASDEVLSEKPASKSDPSASSSGKRRWS